MKSEKTPKTETLTKNQPEIDLELRRELLALAYQSIKEGSQRQIILKYQDINSSLSNEKFFYELHNNLTQSQAKGTLFGLCKSKNIDISSA